MSEIPLPWYRQFWPWFLIAIPALSIVGGIAMIWIAGSGDAALIEEDYYQSGLDINQQLALDRYAREANLAANLLIAAEQPQARVYLFGDDAAPVRLQLTLTSAKDSARDRRVALERVNGQLYVGPIQPLVAGRYTIEILDGGGQWRLRGQADFPTESPVQLSSPPAD